MASSQPWFWSGDSLWWVGRDAPPLDSPATLGTIVERFCDDPHDALGLIGQVFTDDLDMAVAGLLQGELPGLHLDALSHAARHGLLALLISRRALRVWQCRITHPISTDGRWGVLPADPGGRPVRPSGRPPARPKDEPPGGGGTGIRPGPGPAGAAVPDPRVWYEFTLLDELGDGLPKVDVQLTTPGGTHALTTNAAGVVRIANMPPARGSARIDSASLTAALAGRFDRPRRRTRPPPVGPRFDVVTPLRAGRVFELEAEQPHRVMVVSRTDVVVAGADARWQSLAVAEGSQPLCGYQADALHRLHLCSRGQGEAAHVDATPILAAIEPRDGAALAARAAATPAVYVVRRGDSLWAIAERLLGDPLRWPEIRQGNLDLLRGRPVDLIHPGDRLQLSVVPVRGLIPDPDPWPPSENPPKPSFFDLDVDGLHEALFDSLAGDLFDRLSSPLQAAPPPPEADFDSAQPAADAAAVLAAVTSVELGLPLEALFRPVDLPEFDPVERAGPRRA